jgi:LPS O-antigen subunit length determinant protein (WzzB/FepE family)
MSSPQIKSPSTNEEISLIDVLLFFKCAWKTILLLGLLGLVIASMYLFVTPKQYEVSARITMAKLPKTNDVLEANVEEPATLIARLSLPGSFSSTVINACNEQESTYRDASVTKAIKLSIPKGISNLAELKVTRPSPELAKTCINSVIEFINQSQIQLKRPTIDASKARLIKIDERLAQDRMLLRNAQSGGNPVTPTYFALLQDIRDLEDLRQSLLEAIEPKGSQITNFQPPIYVAEKPVYPKRALSLAAGLFGGIFLGLLVAMGQIMIAKLKKEVSSVW